MAQSQRADVAFIVGAGVAAFIAAPYLLVRGDVEAFVAVVRDSLAPKIQLWLFVIGLQAATWVVVGIYLWKWAVDLWRKEARPRVGAPTAWLLDLVVPLAASGAPLVLFLWLIESDFPPAQVSRFDTTRLSTFAFIGTIVAGIAVLGMLVTGRLVAKTAADPTSEVKIATIVRLRQSLDHFVFAAGTILGLGVLGTAALRNAINAAQGHQYFPKEYVILYGGVRTLLLYQPNRSLQTSRACWADPNRLGNSGRYLSVLN